MNVQTIDVFSALKNEAFLEHASCISTVEALYGFLSSSTEVWNLLEALRAESIQENDIEKFVAQLLLDLKKGEKFPHEIELSAIAVALSSFGGVQ